MGRAQVAADLGNRNALTSAIGSVNLAIRGGIQASEYLGCGFPTLAQWQTLRLSQARTRADMNRAIDNATGLIANANGISSPNNLVPSSIDSSGNNQPAIRLLGRWKSNSDSTHINFVQEGTKIRGYR